MHDLTGLFEWGLAALTALSSVFVLMSGRAILGHCQRLELSQRSAIGWGLFLCGALTLGDLASGQVDVIPTAVITVIALGCLVVYRLQPEKQVRILTDMGVLDEHPHHHAN